MRTPPKKTKSDRAFRSGLVFNPTPVNTDARRIMVSPGSSHKGTPAKDAHVCRACGIEFNTLAKLRQHRVHFHRSVTVSGTVASKVKREGVVCLMCKSEVMENYKSQKSHLKRCHGLTLTDEEAVSEHFRATT